jgi:hypothetical protein
MAIRLNKKNKVATSTGSSTTTTSGGISVSSNSSSTDSSISAYLWGNHFTGNNNISGDMSVLGNVTLRQIEDDNDSGKLIAPLASIDALGTRIITNTGKISSESLEAVTGQINALQSHSIESNELSSTEATIHNLKVTGVAQFTELEIDKIKSVGGAMILSPANGFDITQVEYYENDNKYRLYFPKEQDNLFEVGDLVISYEWSGGSNTYYWTEVIWVGSTYYNNIEYNYIDITTNTNEGIVAPQVGQTVVHLGNRSNKDRQNAIIMSSHDLPIESLKAPYYIQYSGISAPTSSLEAFRQSYFSSEGNCITGDLKVSTGQSIEDYISSYANSSGNTYNILDGTNQGTQNWSYYSEEEYTLGSTLSGHLTVTGEEESWLTLYYALSQVTLATLQDKEVYTLSFKTSGLNPNVTKMYISIQDKNGSNALTQQIQATYDSSRDLWSVQVQLDIQDLVIPVNTYGLRTTQHIYIYIPNPSLSFEVYDLMLQNGVVANPTWFISKNDFLGSGALDDIQETITSLQVSQDSIVASVNDTSMKITNGQITLNGNTNINGNLNLMSSDIEEEDDDLWSGLTLIDSNTNKGLCRIQARSIDDYEVFKDNYISNTLSDNVALTLTNNETKRQVFSFTKDVPLGTYEKGDTILVNNPTYSCSAGNDTLHTVLTSVTNTSVNFILMDNVGNVITWDNNTGASCSYESKNSNTQYVLRVIVTGTIVAFVNDDTSFSGVLNTTCNVSFKYNRLIGNATNMLIGYNGINIGFGNGNHVYIGKDKCIFKYGNYGFEISKNGLIIND